MKQVDAGFPKLVLRDADFPEEYDPRQLFEIINTLVNQLRRGQDVRSTALNFNAVKEYAGASAPTPEQGEMYVWNDTGATAGQPTHYIVYNYGGTVVTFASVETA